MDTNITKLCPCLFFLQEPSQGPALSSIRTSPNKRAAQQQEDDATDGSSSRATASPNKHRPEAAGTHTRTNSSGSTQQHPLGVFGQATAHSDGTAATAGALLGTTARQQQEQHTQLQQQPPRLLSKRPAHQFSPDPQPTEQPMVRAARRLRTGGRSCDSSTSSCSPRQGLTDSAMCGQQPSGFAAAAEAASQPKAAAAAAGVAANDVQITSGSGSSSSEVCASGRDAPRAARSSCGRRAGLPPAPYDIPHDGEIGSNAASNHRRSRLSTVTDSNALALVPVTASRRSHCSRNDAWHDGHAGRAAAPQQARPPFSTTAGDAQLAFDMPEPIPEPSATMPGASTNTTSSSSSGVSYRSRAAKAAKGLAKKLKKLFMTATSGSSSHAHGTSGTGGDNNPAGAADAGSSDGGRDSNASSRATGSRDSDFRRSWQGPFFSSGAAARAAAAQDAARQSKDDSHADTERKHSQGKRWPKWARKYGGYSSSDSDSEDERDNIFDQDPFGPAFSPLRHNFCKNNPQHSQQGPGGAAAGAGESPFTDPFGPAFSPLRQSMGFQPSGQQQGAGSRWQRDAGDNNGFGPDWLGID